MKVDAAGNIWAVAAGGVVILSPEGKQLGVSVGMAVVWYCGCVRISIYLPISPPMIHSSTGLISTGEKHTSNVAFGGDGYLYITGLEYLGRIPVLAKGRTV
jgi:sugar lactone lactonase YvrE